MIARKSGLVLRERLSRSELSTGTSIATGRPRRVSTSPSLRAFLAYSERDPVAPDKLDGLHSSISFPPTHTRLRSLTPTARMFTSLSGFTCTS